MVLINFLIFTAVASGVLTGCVNTEGALKIKGKVVDESTKSGIPWKNIIVQGLADRDNKSEPIEVGQFSTDSSGCFTYSLIKIKGVYNYNFCFIGNSDYAVVIHKISLFSLKRNAKSVSFRLSKLVDLTIKINRKSTKHSFKTVGPRKAIVWHWLLFSSYFYFTEFSVIFIKVLW